MQAQLNKYGQYAPFGRRTPKPLRGSRARCRGRYEHFLVRTKLFLALIVVSVPGLTGETAVSNEEFTILNSASNLEILHRLKIGEQQSVEESLAHKIMFNAIAMKQAISRGEADNLEDIWKILALIAVMDEKFNIQMWKRNEEFQSILTSARTHDPSYIRSLRCKNWEKPMWSSDGDCS